MPCESEDVEGPLLGGVGVCAFEFDREVMSRRLVLGLSRCRREIPHAEVVPVEPIPLADVIGNEVPEIVRVAPILGRPEKRRQQNSLARTALAENGDVLLSNPGKFGHGREGTTHGVSASAATSDRR